MPHASTLSGHRRPRPSVLRPVLLTATLLVPACGGPARPGEDAAATLVPLADAALGDRVMAELSGLDRLPGSPGHEAAMAFVISLLEEAGYPPLGTLPPDGPPDPAAPIAYHYTLRDTLALPVWQTGAARLVIVGEGGSAIADTRDTPMVLAYGSAATPLAGLVTELVYLGNGTYEQEYAGTEVTGAMVYGRRPLAAVARAALAHGAIGAVSPAAEPWHDTDGHPDLVAWERVGGGAIGFKIGPDTARRLEAAMERGGGRLRVRLEVDSASVSGRIRTTVAAEIPGTEPTAERVVFIAPVSGPAPGAGDVSGAAALVEAAAALREAVDTGRLARPRRSILFLWGPAVDGVRTWMTRLPQQAEYLHSATVVQLVGTEGQGMADLLVERVPDPAAMWTRPPFEHTPWGAARPPVWPFEGHYLSELTGAIAGSTRPVASDGDTVHWAGHPFEGGADHVALLEHLVPAQRLWHFPYPYYRSSLDLPDRIDPGGVRAAAVVTGALAWTVGRAEVSDARRILEQLDRSARDRLDQVEAAAAERLADGRAAPPDSPERRLEEEIANAWKIWYLEAFESVMGHPVGDEGHRLDGAVEVTVSRLNRDWNDRIGSLGLALLPLPERFLPSRSFVR